MAQNSPHDPTDKGLLTIIWNEYKDQNDWQRHNEVQRASLSTILLGVSAALIAFAQRDSANWAIPALVSVIGLFGAVAVAKYWERFMFHTHQERAFRKLLDSYFPPVYSTTEEQPARLLISTRESGKAAHLAEWSSRWWTRLFTDVRMMQHYLWIALFCIIAIIGLVLCVRAFLEPTAAREAAIAPGIVVGSVRPPA